jgi:aryl-alcohol dehydrogenase (NADP+)
VAPIASASRASQVADLLTSVGVTLTSEQIAELDRLSTWQPAV